MSNLRDSSKRCRHVNARGHRCRMLRAPDHGAFCAQHARQKDRVDRSAVTHTDDAEAQALAARLFGPAPDFSTAASIQKVLGNLVELIASNGIAPRKAGLVAYACQLLMINLRGYKGELHHAEMERRAAAWRQNPQPLPATPKAFANAVFERVLGTKPPAANLAPAGQPHSAHPADETKIPHGNPIK